jgi:hypothetical protein
MHSYFDTFSEDSRLWVFQANRSLQAAEIATLENALQGFLSQWAAHQKALQGAGMVLYNRFLVVAVNEAFQAASGCSIDSLTGFVRQAESQLACSFLERGTVAFLQEDSVHTLPLAEVKSAIAEGKIQADTLIFNSGVATVGDFRRSFQQKAADSWLKRHFAALTQKG